MSDVTTPHVCGDDVSDDDKLLVESMPEDYGLEERSAELADGEQ